MKVLLTGGTGFLGKRLLSLLLEDPSVERVDVVTRSKNSHPHPKIRIISADLSEPASLNQLPGDADVVAHLAGLYDFTKKLPQNYSENVLGSLNLVERLKQWNEERPVPFLFASTYAVGFSSRMKLSEKPLTEVSPRSNPYPYSKAVAERVFTDSGLPGAVFRLGILVGDTRRGEIEKFDGPYAFMRFLLRFRKIQGSRLVRALPIPGKRNGILPLVPVDFAARVFHQAVRMSGEGFFQNPPRPRIYGVYHPESARVEDFVRFAVESLTPWVRPTFMSRVPPILLKAESLITRVPEGNFQFAIHPVELENPEFVRDFGSIQIPTFDEFNENLLRGFLEASGEAHV